MRFSKYKKESINRNGSTQPEGSYYELAPKFSRNSEKFEKLVPLLELDYTIIISCNLPEIIRGHDFQKQPSRGVNTHAEVTGLQVVFLLVVSYLFAIHHRNLQVLATEIFKIHRCLSLEILREKFAPKTSLYNLRRNDTFEKRKVYSVYHGTESLSFLGPKIWDLVPVELKQSETLYSFKLKIRNWVPFECHCRICETYIQQLGFL